MKELTTDAERELRRLLSSRAFVSDESNEDKRRHLLGAIEQVSIEGLWLEFGVSTGASIKLITAHTEQMVYGFDTFEGLPEDWVLGEGHRTWQRGSFRGRPDFSRHNMTLVAGLFEKTLPSFLDTHPERVAFMHIDCDLYSSASLVLQSLRDRLAEGTVIVFDELFNYPRYAEHEMRALLELAATTGMEYSYLGHVPERSAASLKIDRIGTSSRLLSR